MALGRDGRDGTISDGGMVRYGMRLWKGGMDGWNVTAYGVKSRSSSLALSQKCDGKRVTRHWPDRLGLACFGYSGIIMATRRW